jgi:hypothetical protein
LYWGIILQEGIAARYQALAIGTCRSPYHPMRHQPAAATTEDNLACLNFKKLSPPYHQPVARSHCRQHAAPRDLHPHLAMRARDFRR